MNWRTRPPASRGRDTSTAETTISGTATGTKLLGTMPQSTDFLDAVASTIKGFSYTTSPTTTSYSYTVHVTSVLSELLLHVQRRYDMNVRFEMQGGKNWIFPKEMIANRFFLNSHWLEIWSNHFCPSMGPNGGIVAMASDQYKENSTVREIYGIINSG